MPIYFTESFRALAEVNFGTLVSGMLIFFLGLRIQACSGFSCRDGEFAESRDGDFLTSDQPVGHGGENQVYSFR